MRIFPEDGLKSVDEQGSELRLQAFLTEWAHTYPALEGLARALQENTLPHAILLTGPTDLTSQFAGLFAEGLLCTGAVPPCGECESCRQYRAGVHPDFHRVGEQQTGPVKTADIEVLQTWLSRKSHYGGNRVYILQHLDEITPVAGNRLLKGLEEPLSNVLALMTARSSSAVMGTLLSRCFVYPMQHRESLAFEDAAVARSLTALSAEVPSTTGETSGTDATDLIIAYFDRVLQWVQAWVRQPTRVLNLADDFLRIFSAAHVADGLHVLLAVLRDMIHVTVGDNRRLRSPSLLMQFQATDKLPLSVWLRAADIVQETLTRHRAHVVPQLNLERMCIRLCEVRESV
jgi:DNA polymerase-3 subunit delta'